MRQSMNILLVEEHADLAKVTELLLRIDGHTVTVATGVGTAAQADADEVASGAPFDLLLCELGLPDGSYMLRHIQNIAAPHAAIAPPTIG